MRGKEAEKEMMTIHRLVDKVKGTDKETDRDRDRDLEKDKIAVHE